MNKAIIENNHDKGWWLKNSDSFEIVQSNYNSLKTVTFHFNFKWDRNSVNDMDVAIFKVKPRKNESV